MSTKRSAVRAAALGVLSVALALLLACGGGDDDSGGNRLANPGLEDGTEPWGVLDQGSPFERVESQAHSGQASARTSLQAAADDTGTARSHLIQEVDASTLPEELSGYYRVEDWTVGTEFQFVQVAVVVGGATNLPANFPNHQLRFVLAGTPSPVAADGNQRSIPAGETEPALGEWVAFDLDLRQGFIDQWGEDPEGFSLLRLIFETRYESKAEGSAALSADVYFDDLYLGPDQD
jgi:hypothetical protein